MMTDRANASRRPERVALVSAIVAQIRERAVARRAKASGTLGDWRGLLAQAAELEALADDLESGLPAETYTETTP